MTITLTHSPADIIRRLIIALGLGTDPADSRAWPVYQNKEPDTPDNCITVYDTQGILQGSMQPTGEQHEQHGIQVRVRAVNKETGYVKARLIADSLDQDVLRDSVTISSSTYLVQALNRTTAVLAIGYESPVSKRELFTLNFTVNLTQTS